MVESGLFTIVEETIVADIDVVSGELKGFAEVYIVLSKEFYAKRVYDCDKKEIALHLHSFGLNEQQTRIHNVSVDNISARFRCRQPFMKGDISAHLKKYRHLKEWKSVMRNNIVQMREMGQLLIEIPSQCIVSTVSDAVNASDITHSVTEPIVIKIGFTSSNADGLLSTPPASQKAKAKLLRRNDISPKKRKFGDLSQNMTFPSSKRQKVADGTASSLPLPAQILTYNCGWFPCLDTRCDHYSFNLQLTVDKSFVVVCSGNCVATTASADKQRTTYSFRVPQPTSPRDIGFVVGRFCEAKSEENNDDSAALPIRVYCQGWQHDKAVISCSSLPAILSVMDECINNQSGYPFDQCLVVFVRDAYQPWQSFGNLCVLSDELLFDQTMIEQCLETNEILARCVAHGWCRHSIRTQRLCDDWIRIGLRQFLTMEYVRALRGHNEIEYRRSIWRLHRNDSGIHPHYRILHPLSSVQWVDSCQLNANSEFEHKAWIVVCMLRQLLGQQSFHRNVILSAFGSKLGTLMSTTALEQSLKNVFSTKDIDTFFKQWIYGNSFAAVFVEYEYKKKSNRHHIKIERVATKNHCWPSKLESFNNCSVRLRIGEREHSTVEYIRIPSLIHPKTELDFVCQSRPPRINTKAAEADGLANAARNLTAVNSIAVDIENDCMLHLVGLAMDPSIARTQLLYDENRTVRSQLDAIHALRLTPCHEATAALVQTLRDSSNFYRVRLEAGRALAEERDSKIIFDNKQELIEFIKDLWSECVHSNHSLKFESLDTYFLLKHCVVYLSRMRDPEFGRTFIEIVDLITEMLRTIADDIISNNRSQQSAIDDSSLVATLIESTANFYLVSTQSTDTHPKLAAITKRFADILCLQKIFPSHCGRIQSAVLTAFIGLRLNNTGLPHICYTIFEKFARTKSFHSALRMTAFKCCVWYSMLTESGDSDQRTAVDPTQSDIVRHLFALIKSEKKNPGVQLRMIHAWLQIYSTAKYHFFYQKNATVADNNSDQRSVNLEPPLRRFVAFGLFTELSDQNQVQHRKFVELLWEHLIRFIHTSQLPLAFAVSHLYYLLWQDNTPPFVSKNLTL